MDLRSLIKLAPAVLRAPLASLLDRLEAAEKTQAHQSDAILHLYGQLEAVTAELAELRKAMPPTN